MGIREIAAALSIATGLFAMVALLGDSATPPSMPPVERSIEAYKKQGLPEGVEVIVIKLPDPVVSSLTRHCIIYRDVELSVARTTCLP